MWGVGIEPTQISLQELKSCALTNSAILTQSFRMPFWKIKFSRMAVGILKMRQLGIGPRLPAWKAGILPLNYWRFLARAYSQPRTCFTIRVPHYVFSWLLLVLFKGTVNHNYVCDCCIESLQIPSFTEVKDTECWVSNKFWRDCCKHSWRDG